MGRLWTKTLVAGVVCATAAGSAPRPAEACGGLVCDGGGGGGPVISQANERILFVVEDDGAGGTVLTTVVQIQYMGAPDDFAWILPVSEVPDLIDVAPADLFDDLEAATAPTFRFTGPPGGGFDDEYSGGRGGCNFGLGCRAGSSTDSGAYWGSDAGSGGTVTVWGTGTVGPYDLAVISSDTVDPLMEWIVRHGFVEPPGFRTIADDYVKENFKFVVLRLVAEAGVNQIAPLVLRTREALPCVPLRLTAIAAEPDMGIRIFFVGPGRAVPYNYAAATPDYANLAVGGLGAYDSLVSGTVDGSGGQAWVTEFAGDVGDAVANSATGLSISHPEALEYLGRGLYLTRLYTKMSDFEMTEDPFFMFVNGWDVSNGHNVAFDGSVTSFSMAEPRTVLAGEAVLAAGLLGLWARRRWARRRSPRAG